MDSQRWMSVEEDMTDGDLGLGKIAQLDICTGTAVCSRAEDKASGSSLDAQEGGEDDTERLSFHSRTKSTARGHL